MRLPVENSRQQQAQNSGRNNNQQQNPLYFIHSFPMLLK
jgi:hypothetical protein